jgi:hypothetical protein
MKYSHKFIADPEVPPPRTSPATPGGNVRVPATHRPTEDVTWSGADPTVTLDAARRAEP